MTEQEFYLVTYDNSDIKKAEFEETFKAMWVANSSWVVYSSLGNAKAIYDVIMQHYPSTSRLVVARIAKNSNFHSDFWSDQMAIFMEKMGAFYK